MDNPNSSKVNVAPSVKKTAQFVPTQTQGVQTPKAKTPVAAAPPVFKKTVFCFKQRPAIATKGLHPATFISAINESGGEGDNEYNHLKVAVKLAETDPKGQPFTVQKLYNILPTGRGISAFLDDFNSWSGEALTEDDLYSEFDCDARIKDKPVVVEIDHRKKGSDWEAFIKSFHPDGYTGETANEEPVTEEQPT